MRVWIENPFDTLPVEGFRPQRYWLMAEAFVRAGHDVTLWTSDFSHATKSRRTVRAGDAPFTLRFVPTPPYTSNVSFARIRSHRAYAAEWLAEARDEARKGGAPDIVIVSLPPLKTADSAIALKREFGARLVVDVMDAWPETFYRLFPSVLRPFASLALLPLRRAAVRAYRDADLVTGVCDAYGKIALAAGAREYARFYHGVRMAKTPATAARKPADPSSIRLAYVGNFGRGYDLTTAIRAVCDTPGMTLDVAGAGEREREWRKCANGSSRIRFHGFLGEEELSSLLDSCDVGIIPLADDTFVGLPYKLGDYAIHGLRVVTSLRGECAAILERHRAGRTYTAGDVGSFKAAVADALADDPGFSSLLSELDANSIYDEYVKRVTIHNSQSTKVPQ